MITIKVTPLLEVGGVRFGMKRNEVRDIFGEATEFKKSQFSQTTTDDFGFCHVFYNINNECEAIEVFGEAEVQINGETVFPGDISRIKTILSDLEEDDYGFICKSKSIGVYAPDNEMESILFGCVGYYG